LADSPPPPLKKLDMKPAGQKTRTFTLLAAGARGKRGVLFDKNFFFNYFSIIWGTDFKKQSTGA